jgi:hypothetical protein
MEQGLVNTGHTVNPRQPDAWEYFLVTEPDERVQNKIRDEVQSIFSQENHRGDFSIKPSVTIARFYANQQIEETLIRWIQRICSHHQSFPVTLNIYGALPPDTIYLRIQDEPPFRNLVNQLKVIDEYIKSSGQPGVWFNNRPFVRITGRLKPAIYNKALPDFSREMFHESFLLSELILLKRINDFDPYRQVNVFRFYPPDTNMYNEVA